MMTASPTLAFQRRITPLIVVGAVAIPLLVAVSVYLYGATFRPLFDGNSTDAGDFSFFVEGTQRFLGNPATTYDGADFLYPPPSVLLFIPLVRLPLMWGYTLLAWLNVVALAVSVGLFLHLYRDRSRRKFNGWSRAALYAAAFASAPFFQTVKMGQVGGLVLLSSLLFLTLLGRRPAVAAGVLTAGFWLKLYPIALAVLVIKNARRGRVAFGFAIGLVAVPLALSPFIPLRLYATYADFVATSGNLSNIAAMNQGIPAVLSRLTLPADVFTTYTGHSIVLFPRVVTIVVGAGFGLALVAEHIRGRLDSTETGIGLLALLPVVSVLGWEHTYILALPLVWWMLLGSASSRRLVQVAVVAGTLVFFIPKPPEPIVVEMLAQAPRSLSDLFHARFLLVTLGFLIALLVTARRYEQEIQPD